MKIEVLLLYTFVCECETCSPSTSLILWVWEALKWRHLALILDQSPSKWRVLPFHGFIHISSSCFHLPFPFSHHTSISIRLCCLALQFYLLFLLFLCFLFNSALNSSFQSIHLLYIMFIFGLMCCSCFSFNFRILI